MNLCGTLSWKHSSWHRKSSKGGQFWALSKQKRRISIRLPTYKNFDESGSRAYINSRIAHSQQSIITTDAVLCVSVCVFAAHLWRAINSQFDTARSHSSDLLSLGQPGASRTCPLLTSRARRRPPDRCAASGPSRAAYARCTSAVGVCGPPAAAAIAAPGRLRKSPARASRAEKKLYWCVYFNITLRRIWMRLRDWRWLN